jgi:glycosylphosphatidylinositol deacylase
VYILHMNHSMLSVLLGVFTAVTIFASFRASIQVPDQLSPQGCRMSYMSPSYILQSGFNASWTSLSGRYSLWLYREVGWENNQVCRLRVGGVQFMNSTHHSHQERLYFSFLETQVHLIKYAPSPPLQHGSISPLHMSYHPTFPPVLRPVNR